MVILQMLKYVNDFQRKINLHRYLLHLFVIKCTLKRSKTTHIANKVQVLTHESFRYKLYLVHLLTITLNIPLIC